MVEEVIEEGKSKKNFLKENYFFILIFLSLFLAIGASFYNFYYKKNFNFIIETSCNPEVEECTYRDCTNPEDCPPNQLSVFKRYVLNAGDFKNCSNEDCKDFCERENSSCELLVCEENEEYAEFCEPLEIEEEILPKEEGNIDDVLNKEEIEVNNIE